MRKFGYVVAALGAIAIALPSVASAETFVIKRHGYHHDWDRARAEYRERSEYRMRPEYRMHRDYGWHRGWRDHDRDRVVIREHRDRY
jgi:hypothetical protein